MKIFAIGDLHLTQDENKKMDKFGWGYHEEKIFLDWQERVSDEDVVLIAGDISWAMRFDEAILDIKKISSQKGKKILVKGNHDYWWSSIKKLNSLHENMHFLQNNIFEFDKFIIAGSRLWLSPNKNAFTDEDEKIFKKELIRLKNSLEQTKNIHKDIIVLSHFPPTNDELEDFGIIDILKEYNIKHMVYGHLHGENFHKNTLIGQKENINYHLVSCDYTNFKLVQIDEY